MINSAPGFRVPFASGVIVNKIAPEPSCSCNLTVGSPGAASTSYAVLATQTIPNGLYSFAEEGQRNRSFSRLLTRELLTV